MKATQCERQDYSYERHGTQCLIANFEVATGKILKPSIGDTRTEQDFLAHSYTIQASGRFPSSYAYVKDGSLHLVV